MEKVINFSILAETQIPYNHACWIPTFQKQEVPDFDLINLRCLCWYTAAPLYRGPIDRGNRYNAVVLCRPLLIKKKFETNI